MALLLSGNINLNPGPVTIHQINDPKFEVFNNKGLHLIYLNINRLLHKINELCNIAKCFNAVVIRINKTKLGNIVYHSEVNIDGYNIVRNDRNRKCGDVACYITSTICYSKKTCFSDNLENILIDFLFIQQNLCP